MATVTNAKYKVAQLYTADPITSEAGIATAKWKKCPFTLRDDIITIKSDEPEVEELYAHEQDAPVEVDYEQKPTTVTGSFINLTAEQLIEFFEGKALSSDKGVALMGKLCIFN